jgi:hypothetical protein
MTLPESAYDLIRFMQHLHDMNSDHFGFVHKEGRDRGQRWMDVVLPPPPPKGTIEVPFPKELRKASQKS